MLSSFAGVKTLESGSNVLFPVVDYTIRETCVRRSKINTQVLASVCLCVYVCVCVCLCVCVLPW